MRKIIIVQPITLYFSCNSVDIFLELVTKILDNAVYFRLVCINIKIRKFIVGSNSLQNETFYRFLGNPFFFCFDIILNHRRYVLVKFGIRLSPQHNVIDKLRNHKAGIQFQLVILLHIKLVCQISDDFLEKTVNCMYREKRIVVYNLRKEIPRTPDYG